MSAQVPDSELNGHHAGTDAGAMRRLVSQPGEWPLYRYEREAGFDWLRLANVWTVVTLGFIEVMLAFRLGFRLADANTDNGFVSFMYDVTGVLVAPFEGIIAQSRLGAGGVFEPSILVAMLVYMVAAVLLMSVVWAIVTTEDARRPARQRSAAVEPAHPTGS